MKSSISVQQAAHQSLGIQKMNNPTLHLACIGSLVSRKTWTPQFNRDTSTEYPMVWGEAGAIAGSEAVI